MGERHTSDEDERRRREVALRAIAAQQSSAGAPGATALTPSRPHRPYQGARRPLTLALVALLLIGGGIFGWLRIFHLGGNPTTQRMTLTFPDGALVCASDAAWAPRWWPSSNCPTPAAQRSPRGGTPAASGPPS